MQLLEDYAVNNNLSNASGKSKMLFSCMTLLVCVFSTSIIVPLLIFVIMIIVTVGWARIPLKFYIKLLLAPIGFGLIALIAMTFFFGIEPWFSIDIFGFTLTATKDGFSRALISTGRMLGSVTCLLFLALTTPMADIFVLLHKLHLPAVFIELSMLIYRNIFVMLQEALRMEYAQKMRLGYSDISGSIRALSMLAGNLFIRSWDSAERTLIAMDSRCYDGTIRVLVEDPPVSKTFLFGLVGFELVLIYLNIIIPV